MLDSSYYSKGSHHSRNVRGKLDIRSKLKKFESAEAMTILNPCSKKSFTNKGGFCFCIKVMLRPI